MDRSASLKTLVTVMQKWLSATYGGEFQNQGGTFPIGLQDDGSSCGVCVANSMAHAMVDQSLFTHHERDNIRMQCFTTILEYVINGVSAEPCLPGS